MTDRRSLLGWTSFATLFLGLAIHILQPSFVNVPMCIAACIRVGIMLGVLWLAYRDLQNIPAWMWTCLIVLMIVVAIRPRAAFVILPTLALARLLNLKFR